MRVMLVMVWVLVGLAVASKYAGYHGVANWVFAAAGYIAGLHDGLKHMKQLYKR